MRMRRVPPAKIVEIIKRFGTLNLPIAITECDVDSNDPEYQADFMSDLLTAVFSCEEVEEFLLWGFWARSHWRPNSALLTQNWELTPIGKVWTEFVEQTTRSSQEGESDFSGVFKTRLYCGEYEIVAKNGAQSGTTNVVVTRDGTEVVARVR